MMQYVLMGPSNTSVGSCTLHLCYKTNTLVSEECSFYLKPNFISKLAFEFFFNSNFFVFVVVGLRGALPMQSAYVV